VTYRAIHSVTGGPTGQAVDIFRIRRTGEDFMGNPNVTPLATWIRSDPAADTRLWKLGYAAGGPSAKLWHPRVGGLYADPLQ